MNLIISYLLFLLHEVKLSKLELLNPREMQKVLSLTKVTNEAELLKCQSTWNGQFYPEIPYVHLFCDTNLEPMKNKPDLSHCSGFDCWESQLSQVSRVDIVRIMNQYREKVSKDKCQNWCKKNNKKIIFELMWDRVTEAKAVDLIKNCPSNMSKSETSTVTVDGGNEVTSKIDISATSFKMELGTQKELRIILWRLMSGNHLYDWIEGTSQFRRSLMHDVGCAFVVRRGVNYVTALGENVKNGIVGHFVCVYQSLLPSEEPPDSTKPSLSSCKSLSGNVQVNFDNYNYFPNLCRIDLEIDVSVLKRSSHSCTEGPENVKNLCPSSEYSADTWDEKFYGLIIKLVNPNVMEVTVDCNVPHDIPQFEKHGENVYNYFCTLKEKVMVQANTSNCSNWDCEDSQLTDITRLKILNQLNEARHLVANGQCSEECPPPCKYCNKSINYCNMAKLQWHWFLEMKASQLVRNCSPYYVIKNNVFYEDNPFPDPVVFDEIFMVLDFLPTSGGQMRLGEVFSSLFWANKQKDWPDDKQFRRGSAAFFGCSIIVRTNMKFRNQSSIKIHMVCIYATLQEKFTSLTKQQNHELFCCPNCSGTDEIRPCPFRYRKLVDPYPALCTSVALQITMNCQDRSYCEDQGHSKAWLQPEYDGMTIYQKVDGSFEGVIRNLTFFQRYRAIIIMLIILSLLSMLFICCFVVKYFVSWWKTKRQRERLSADEPVVSKTSPVKDMATAKPTRTTVRTPVTTQKPVVAFETTIPTRPTEKTSTETTRTSEIEDIDVTVENTTPKPRLKPQIIRKVPKSRAHLYQ